MSPFGRPTASTTPHQPDQYNEGLEAGLRGASVWENPYSGPNDIKSAFMSWFAGWCQAQKRRANIGNRR